MTLLVLIVLLAVIFGVGNVLEAALWLLLIIAVVVVAAVFLGARAIRNRLS